MQYGRLLRWALGHRKIVLAGTVAMLLVSLLMIPVIGFQLSPLMDKDAYSVSIALDQDTNLNITNQVMQSVESMIKQMPETASIYTRPAAAGATACASRRLPIRPASMST